MIKTETIDQIAAQVNTQGLSEAMVSTLRGQWPDIHFTYCSDDDVSGPRPLREFDSFNVYLVDGREHCLKFTSDPQAATGLVLAEVEPEWGE